MGPIDKISLRRFINDRTAENQREDVRAHVSDGLQLRCRNRVLVITSR